MANNGSRMRTSAVLELAPGAAMLASLATLGWVLARTTWLVAVPATADAVRPVQGIDLAAARNAVTGLSLFQRAGGAKQPAAAPTRLNLRLLGLYAAHAGRSYAVLSLDGKRGELAAQGGEVAPGIVLERVARDHVMIRRQGQLERVDFPAGAAGGFNLEVRHAPSGAMSFSRDTLNQALQSPGQLAQLGALSVSPGVGVTIVEAPPGSLAQKLSLHPGDLIHRVNGQPVSTEADLARLYRQFSSAGEITLEGTRNGAALKLSYVVEP